MNMIKDQTNLVDEIITKKTVKTLFQPIVKVKCKKIMILEALSRGMDSSGNLISPFILFNKAAEISRLTELDLLCIESSLRSFNKINMHADNILLSVNVNIQSIIENKNHDWFYNIVKKNQNDPKRIIIEILENSTTDIEALIAFVEYNKKKGFLIALDDIGSGYSGLMRVSILKPDIIKIDKSLITGISNKKSNQFIVRSLTELGHSLGVLVTGEGIETEEDAVKLMELGLDLQQGYFYSKPNDDIVKITSKTYNAIENASVIYKNYIKKRQFEILELRKQRTKKIQSICKKLKNSTTEELETKLKSIIKDDTLIEFVYILDNKGIMITNTICRKNDEMEYAHYIFKPANKGEDFSLKNYFINLDSEKEVYISSPYISTATGIECVTASKKFFTEDAEECILCVDLMSSHEMYELEQSLNE